MSILPIGKPQAQFDCGLCSQSNSESAQDYFMFLASHPLGIADYFKSTERNLLIKIYKKGHRRFETEGIYEVTLSFAVAPQNINPIKELLLTGSVKRHWTFSENEFRFSFLQVFDLKDVMGGAWHIAVAYRKLGYQCRIARGTEEIDVDGLIADTNPSALRLKLEAVACA